MVILISYYRRKRNEGLLPFLTFAAAHSLLCPTRLQYRTRMKKFLNNRLSTEPQSQRKCIEHLQHDFMVQQYLQETTSKDSNYKSYINLINTVAFNNQTKRRHIKFLANQRQAFAEKGEEGRGEGVGAAGRERWRELADFQKRIVEEQQIRGHLQAELKEVTKSINLMRGDVSRIVEKNESTIVLQKKSSKVKLIAHDQLKKVNLALHKDHAEILERNNMQIRFDKKLKNICNNENNMLKKIQAEYLRLQRRKKLINEKIVRMEEIMRGLSEREKTREEISIINERNRINLEEIMKLHGLIKQIQEKGQCEREEQREEGLLDSHLSLKTQRFKTKVKEIQSDIISHIGNITLEIEQADKFYRCSTEKLEEYKAKLADLQKEQRSYEQFLSSAKNCVVSEQEQHAYDKKLVNFKRSLNLLLLLWQFVQNHPNFTLLIDQSNNTDSRGSRRQQAAQSRFYRKSEQFQKNSCILSEQANFSNKLYKLMLFLGGEGEEINLESEFIMKSLEMTTIMWLKGLKGLIVEEMNLRKTDKLKKARSLESIKYKSTFELLQEAEPSYNKYRLSVGDEEEDKLKTMLELISPKKSTLYSETHKPHAHAARLRKTQGDEDCTAKRIKVLQKVDYDYYKMLKNVLQIQKQNIKKNYDFNKTFNRSKFTEKNILQEEKRYESNFALEFIKKEEQGLESHRSIASRTSEREKSFKRRDFHHRTDMMNHLRRDSLASSRKGSKPKESFFNAGKLQRKSKLVQRGGDESPRWKESRTSLFCSKRGINFAELAIREQY